MDRNDFIKTYAKVLTANKASLFLGAGFSMNSQLPSWEKLLSTCADELEISLGNQSDYSQIAQYYEIYSDRTRLESIIEEQIDKLIKPDPRLSDFLSLNFQNIWTTNFDRVIETSLESNDVRYNVITTDEDLKHITENKVNIFKCGGDIKSHKSLFITRKDYEDYEIKRTALLYFLKRELIINNFLFIGYSFKDGLIKQQLRTVNSVIGNDAIKHYAIIFEDESETFKYYIRDLEKNYNVQVVTVSDVKDFFTLINDLTNEIKKHYVYIAGSIKELDSNDIVLDICKSLSKNLLENDYYLVSAAGSHIGNYIFGAALKYISECKEKYKRDKLIIEPIPKAISHKEIHAHRKNLLSKCGSIIFISGDKGTLQEYEIAKDLNLKMIPVPSTKGAAKKIFTELANVNKSLAELKTLQEAEQIANEVINILKNRS